MIFSIIQENKNCQKFFQTEEVAMIFPISCHNFFAIATEISLWPSSLFTHGDYLHDLRQLTLLFLVFRQDWIRKGAVLIDLENLGLLEEHYQSSKECIVWQRIC